MDVVTVKFKEEILSKVDKTIKEFNFNSRTEFIREAVRDKLSELDREKSLKKFLSLRGKIKQRSWPEDDEKIREKVSKEAEEFYNKKFGFIK